MRRHNLTKKQVTAYRAYLREEERAAATIEKYSRDIQSFAGWLGAPAR